MLVEIEEFIKHVRRHNPGARMERLSLRPGALLHSLFAL